MYASWPQKKWLFPQERAPLSFLSDFNLSPIAGRLLQNRGITTPEQLQTFLHPRLSSLPDPDLLPDMELASQRLARAITRREEVVIYGDYDADGVTATALLYSFLDFTGCPVSWYIPHRAEEGYSLNCEAIQKIASEGNSLIVTVDCGSNSLAEAALAKKLGLDLIITDHHPITGDLPEAVAIVNPQRPECRFPDTNLAGVGVAFHLVASTRRLLRRRGFWNQRNQEIDIRELLDLVAIGSIADVVPLTNVNRTLVTAGLAELSNERRPGMRELCDLSGVNLPISAGDISFKIAPRINAHGRMWRADEGVKMLLTKDPRLAKALAVQLDTANNQRKAIEKEVVEDCESILNQNPSLQDKEIIILGNNNWHPGVVGIVAGRLMTKYGKPVIIIGKDGKGSGRSPATIDLAALLQEGADLLQHFGGHPAAAGVRMDLENIPALRDRLNNILISRNIHQEQPPLPIDAEITLDDLKPDLIEFLQTLEPCGQGNQSPIFVTRNIPIKDIRLIGGQEHIKILINHPEIKEALGFKMGSMAPAVHGSTIDLAYTVSSSSYNGRRELNLKIEDIIWK